MPDPRTPQFSRCRCQFDAAGANLASDVTERHGAPDMVINRSNPHWAFAHMRFYLLVRKISSALSNTELWPVVYMAMQGGLMMIFSAAVLLLISSAPTSVVLTPVLSSENVSVKHNRNRSQETNALRLNVVRLGGGVEVSGVGN